MSERPFMQLYVSDFIGDTLSLSTEQIGAYMLLLMAMWNAGGKLPADDAKLARVARLSVKKWKAIADDLLSFFEEDGNTIRHNRLTKELQKSESKSQLRASAGAEGGRAKALKDKEAHLANAIPEPQHLPDTITREDTSSLRSDVAAQAPRKRAHRMPDDFSPDLDFAVAEGMTISQAKTEADAMRDWSRSSPNGAKLDWPATWRGWVRRALKDRPQLRSQAPPRKSAFQQHQDDIYQQLKRETGDTDDKFAGTTLDIGAGDYRAH